MTRLARLIFANFWSTISLIGALGEWALWWWLRGTPAGILANVTTVFGLWCVNRLAASALEHEVHHAPVRNRLGSSVLAVGIVAAGGATALVTGAAAWLAVSWLFAIPAEAGAVETRALTASGFQFVAVAFIAAGTGVMTWGYVRGHRRLRISTMDATLPGLPATLDGLRIAHVSDLHLGPLADRAGLRSAIDRTLALDPDLICVTGDIVDSKWCDLDAWLPELARLHARHGVWAILGNHDCWAGAERVAAALRHHTDWHVLRDEVARVEIGGAALYLVGVEDRAGPLAARVAQRLLATVPAGAPRVVLLHQPDGFRGLSGAIAPLVLAGHTHGGQIAVPGLPRLNPARILMTRYAGGTFVERGAVMHVNRGLGVSGQRLRVGVPREITVLTLVDADAIATG